MCKYESHFKCGMCQTEWSDNQDVIRDDNCPKCDFTMKAYRSDNVGVLPDKLKPTGHKRKSDLLEFLQEECKRYRTEILPLYPDTDHGSDNGFENFDADKNEFLESLWDVIYEHFTDEKNGGFLIGPDGV